MFPSARRLRSGLALALGALAVSGARSAQPLACNAAIEVLQGTRRVPDAFVAEVARATREEIERRGCVRALVGVGETPELALRLIVDNAEEETVHGRSIADRSQAQGAQASLDYASIFEVRWQAEIVLLESGASERTKVSRAKTERRPAFLGEDTAAAARHDAARNIARQARGFLCGSAGHRLCRARNAAPAAGEAAPTPR